MTPLQPPPIMHLYEVMPSSVIPSTFQLLLQAAVYARLSTFDMRGFPRPCLFFGACVKMYIGFKSLNLKLLNIVIIFLEINLSY